MNDDKETANTASRSRFRPEPCPVCKKMSLYAFRPFCSSRCRDVDLGRWLGGRYAIAADEGGEVDNG